MSETDSLLRVVEDVTFAQLRTFACAARAGSFAKAAEQLDISQPVVSEQIRALEDRLGRRLFVRRRGTTSLLTAEGEEALEIVETILSAGNRLFGRHRMSTEKVLLRISAGSYLRESFRALIPRIYREHPDVEIELHPAFPTAEVLQKIEKGEFDLALYATSMADELPPYTRQICELPLVMVAPPGTRARLASGESSLEDYQFLFPGSKEVGLRWARRMLRDLGLAPKVQPLFIEFVDSLAQMVEEGHGIGHLLAYSVADRIASGRLETLDIPLAPMRRLISRSPHAPDVARGVEDIFTEGLAIWPQP